MAKPPAKRPAPRASTPPKASPGPSKTRAERLAPWVKYLDQRAEWTRSMAAADPKCIAALRAEGYSWERISGFLGGTPTSETLRRRYGGQ